MGKIISEIRGSLKQEEFCEIIGTTQGNLSKIEKGMVPSLDILIRISEYGQVSINDLYKGINKKYRSNPLDSAHHEKIESEDVDKWYVEGPQGEEMRNFMERLVDKLSEANVKINELEKENAHLKEELAKAKKQNFAQG